MGHALKRIWEALDTTGILIDVRPITSPCAIAIATPAGAMEVGIIDGSGMAADDAVADEAVEQAVAEGLFAGSGVTHFDFDMYWDTAEEMRSFLIESRRMREMDPSLAELERVHHQELQGGGRLRIRRNLMLAVYRKVL